MDKIEKPWGYYIDHFRSKNCVMKTITIKPNESISLQYHRKRCESWYILSGIGWMSLDGVADGSQWGLALNQYEVEAGDSVYIGQCRRHKIENVGEEMLVIAEMQIGECEEDDIVRIEDKYGRDQVQQTPEVP